VPSDCGSTRLCPMRADGARTLAAPSARPDDHGTPRPSTTDLHVASASDLSMWAVRGNGLLEAGSHRRSANIAQPGEEAGARVAGCGPWHCYIVALCPPCERRRGLTSASAAEPVKAVLHHGRRGVLGCGHLFAPLAVGEVVGTDALVRVLDRGHARLSLQPFQAFVS